MTTVNILDDTDPKANSIIKKPDGMIPATDNWPKEIEELAIHRGIDITAVHVKKVVYYKITRR